MTPIFDNAYTPEPQSTEDILQKLKPTVTVIETTYFTTPTKESVVETPKTEPQFDHTPYPMPIVKLPLQQETPYNKVVVAFEHETPDKVDGCATDSFDLSQCSDFVCDFEVENANDFSKFPTANDEDDIKLDKGVVDPQSSYFFKDCRSQLFLKDAILTVTIPSEHLTS